MGLPWIQVAAEVIEHAAPELAVALDWNEDSALAGLVRMFRWAADRCPDDRPPSASDVVKGSSAAKLIARAAGFKGDVEAFVSACEAVFPDPILERTPDGIRVLGLKRYDAAWARANPVKAMEWRNRSGSEAEPTLNRSGTEAVSTPKIEIEIKKESLKDIVESEVPLLTPEDAQATSAVEEVIAYYLEAMRANGMQPRATKKRKRLVRARLDEGLSVQELKLAVDGLTWSDWHMGRDPKTNGTAYTDIRYCMKDADTVEAMTERIPKNRRGTG